MKKTNWMEFKGYQATVIPMNELDSSALFLLYDNSSRMCNESNNSVSVATVSPEVWLDDISNLVIENVSYVAKNPVFQMLSYRSTDNIHSTQYSCDMATFDSFNELTYFIKEKGKFSTLVLFSIVKYVNLDTLVVSWGLRYKEIVDPKQIRDKKLEYLTK